MGYVRNADDFAAIELKSEKKVIGNVYFGSRDFEAREIGYIVNKKYQRCGYAFEAITEMMKLGEKEHIHRLFAECDPRNICSWKLLEKLGFDREAFFKKNVYFKKDDNGNPLWQDTYVYGYLSDR